MSKKGLNLTFCIILLFVFLMTASAHPGRTDKNGGHYNRSTGEYHYHSGEYAGRSQSSSSSSTKKKTTKETESSKPKKEAEDENEEEKEPNAVVSLLIGILMLIGAVVISFLEFAALCWVIRLIYKFAIKPIVTFIKKLFSRK